MIRRIQPDLEKPVYLLFFLSGACSLVYEVIWGKYLSLFIGNTTHAHMIVLATYMGGAWQPAVFYSDALPTDCPR